MRLQDHQKRVALNNMTEDDTPFKASRTQSIFRNTANVSLRGSTYDATHLDKFLSSNFGEKSLQINEGGHYTDNLIAHSTVSAHAGPGGGGGSNMISYLLNGTTNSIKPSVSFISMGRQDYKQIKYTDENNGPSPLQILGNEKAFKDKHPQAKTVFEKEREDHLAESSKKMKVLDDVKKKLYTNYSEASSSLEPGQFLQTPA